MHHKSHVYDYATDQRKGTDMGRPAGKWPTYALGALEKTVDELKELERKVSAAQDAIVLGDDAVALRDLSDARVLALKCVGNLVESRIGNYQKQEIAPEWNRPTDKQAARAVAQVVAARRP
jgi:hypothetical protein